MAYGPLVRVGQGRESKAGTVNGVLLDVSGSVQAPGTSTGLWSRPRPRMAKVLCSSM